MLEKKMSIENLFLEYESIR